MLKQQPEAFVVLPAQQPPSGGCVLKLRSRRKKSSREDQPPSGGCVLKLVKENEMNNQLNSRLRAAVC